MPGNFTVNQADLTHILKQIRIAELHAGTNGTPVSVIEAIRQIYGISADAAALTPFGLRAVDGSNNNLLPGNERLGAADTLFPRLLDPKFGNDQDGDSIALGPPGSGAPTVTNTNYGAAGSVADADPRIISNLIVSMTNDNPAAVAAWRANPLAMEAYQEAHGGALPPLGYIPTNEEISSILNQSPDIGLSPGFNSWMTFFGQFFDHGLDLVTKGNNGTVYIPLQPDDPLYVPGSPTNFMALTRATPTLDANGIPQHENTTTPFIDQNQTYTSHPSHQVFLRAYALDANGHAVATGKLLDGQTATGSLDGAIGTWNDVKAQALEMLGIRLSDFDVHNVPLLATDQYGRFIAGPNGYAQIVMAPDADHTANWLKEGTAAGITTEGSIGTGHAFLNDIAHHAAPGLVDHDHDPATARIQQVADTDPGVGDDGDPLTYDDEMLGAHFITGDGRGNENIALTAVHSVFHSEHNRLVEANKATILAAANAGDIGFLNEWLAVDVTSVPADTSTLVWDGERLFQAARFVTEMQYQHLVFEEFARRIQPNVNPFIFTNSADIDPGILAEFAHTVYRFGHSMLTNTVERLENDLTTVNGDADQASLLEAFLNPQMYVASGASVEAANAAIIRGTTRDVGNEIDEFIVDDLRNNLVGLPLDLAALNIARGRDTGVPSLNDTRAQLYEDFGAADLKPYTGWLDFARHIKTPMSVVNFIAAYGTHESITTATTNEERRDAAMKLVFGDGNNADGVTIRGTTYSNAERIAFLNGTDAYTGSAATGAAGSHGGLNKVDLWIGGLAEELNEFGGMLGSTFNFVFEYQMEQLQNGDRFYYLSRTQGMNLLNQLEPNTFTDLVMRNTELGDQYSTHLNGALFTTPDHILELDRGIAQADYNGALDGSDPEWDDEIQQLIDPKVTREYDGATTVVDGNGVTHDVGGTLIYSGGEHVVLGGTEGNDILRGDKGIDTLWGDGGNDYLNAGMESDTVFGGDGDDIIEDPFGDDLLRGGRGNDVISGGVGLDILFGEQGKDFIVVGQDDSEVFAGQDDDFVLGGAGNDALLGNEGNDWIEGGDGFDSLSGENSELFFNSQIIGNDVLNGGANDTDYDGETGDDIMVQSSGIQRSNGMAGFDWAIHKGDPNAANSNLGIPIFTGQPAFILRDRFDLVEGLSGWKYNDTLIGRVFATGAVAAAGGLGVAIPGNFDSIDSFSNSLLEKNVHLIDGLQEIVAHVARSTFTFNGQTETVVINTDNGEDILLGGGGSDVIMGMAGDDIISGDQWLNVRIRVRDANGVEIGSAEGMTAKVTDLAGNDMFGGRQLSALMLDRTINPGQLEIVREILNGGQAGDVDVAVYNDNFNINAVTRTNVDEITDGTYTITRHRDANGNLDGSFTVAHTGFNAATAPPPPDGGQPRSDGIDRLFGIENVRFANGEFSLRQLLNNNPNGAPIITDQTPQENVLNLATLGTLVDPEGINLQTVQFQWQESGDNGLNWTNIGGAVGDVFTPVDLPGNTQVGHLLRVQVTYTDGGGTFETTFSGATGQVGDFWIGEAGMNNLFIGTEGDDIATGVDPDGNGVGGNDFLQGNGGNDILNGLGGNDVLDGGAGIDQMVGGTGDDTYNVDDDLDVVIENAGEGTDKVFTSLEEYTLADNLENLEYNGDPGTAFTGTGNAADNVIVGGVGNDTLNGLGGNDTLDGGLGIDTANGGIGDDTYIVRESGDIVNELAGEGNDEVRSLAAAYTLSANVETLRYVGATGNFTGTGNNEVNTIVGGDGNDILSGGGGLVSDGVTDTLIGGLGNDTYDVDTLGEDNIIENVGEGSDTIRTSLNAYALQNGVSIENLTFDGVGNFIGTGNDDANVLTSNGGNDTLDGGLGIDTMAGGGGNDVYLVDNTSDVVVETALGGTDTVNATANTYTIGANVETLNFVGTGDFTGTGNATANAINGGTGNDTIDGGGGIDTMTGGLGNDSYVVDVAGDVVVENVASGSDTIRTALATYSLNTAGNANVENLTYTGAGTFNGTGNALDNVIIGGALNDTLNGGIGNDTLDGGAGTDTMVGGVGDDTFVVRDATDVITEAAAGGLADQALVHINTYTLAGNVENMSFVGAGNFTGTGNGGNNTVTGAAGNDVLNGGGGNDTLIGLAGNNAFTGAGGVDTVSYAAATGSVTASLAAGVGATANGFGGQDTFTTVENLIGSNQADNLTGDGNANRIEGGQGADTIISGGGVDVVLGGDGVDIINAGANAANTTETVDAGAGADFINQLSTDGRDFIDGGTSGTDKDTYRLSGVAAAEAFTIYTRAAALAAAPAIPGIATLNANTEIVVTRTVAGVTIIVAELDNIEEITVNTLDTTANDGNGVVNGGANGGDTIAIIGDFTQTSLDFNTITIDGTAGNDVVDISQLTSAHRIVFRQQGGNDTVVGEIRPQDVVTSADGSAVTGTTAPSPTPSAAPTSGNDLLVATDDEDFIIRAGGGDDVVRGGRGDDELRGGSGDDDLSGGKGDDALYGGSGDDVLSGGEGDDELTGGTGDDLFVFGGGDTVTDFKVGADKIDLSAMGITATNFASMVRMSTKGDDTVIKIGNAEMLIEDVSPRELRASSFEFFGGSAAGVRGAAETVNGDIGSALQTISTPYGNFTIDPAWMEQLAPLAGSLPGNIATWKRSVVEDANHQSFDLIDDDFSFNLENHHWGWQFLP